MFSLSLVVREFKLVRARLLVVYITCVASLVLLQETDRNELAPGGDTEDFSSHADLLGVKGICVVEVHSIERLSGRTKRFPDLGNTR